MRLRSRILRFYKIQIGLHCSVSRVKPKRFPPLLFGQAVESPRIVGDPQVQTRRYILRIYFLCPVKFLDGIVVQTLVPERDAELREDVRKGRRETEGLAIFFYGIVQESQLSIDIADPQVLVRKLAPYVGVYGLRRRG